MELNEVNIMDIDYPSDKYWAEYLADCKATKTRPSLGDYLVWCDDMGLDYEHV